MQGAMQGVPHQRKGSKFWSHVVYDEVTGLLGWTVIGRGDSRGTDPNLDGVSSISRSPSKTTASNFHKIIGHTKEKLRHECLTTFTCIFY